MKKWFRDTSLTWVLTFIFLLSIAGQMIAGRATYNSELKLRHLPEVNSWAEYALSSHFLSSLFENWESEFLQMALFVLLTVFLYQKGSAESNKPPEQETAEDHRRDAQEEKYRQSRLKKHPILWRLYENSLTISLLLLFIFSFLAHAWNAVGHINLDKQLTGEPLVTFATVFSENEFWFESFQNWQSEFFSIAILGLLSIYLRQKGSPQSKRLNDAASDTGSD